MRIATSSPMNNLITLSFWVSQLADEESRGILLN
jgi:hypothetical protein